jgi:hypothetical protein
MVPSTEYRVPGTGYRVPSTGIKQVPSTAYRVPGTTTFTSHRSVDRCPASRGQGLDSAMGRLGAVVLGTRYSVLGTFSSVLGTFSSVLGTFSATGLPCNDAPFSRPPSPSASFRA